MNRKGDLAELLKDHAIYIIILLLFVAGLFYFIYEQRNGAGIWSDFYSKEIVKVINLAEPGDKIVLDIHKASVVAQKNEMGDFGQMFRIDSEKGEVCVRLSTTRKSCYGYFNDVAIVNVEIELGVPGNILKFDVVKKNVAGGANA